MTGLWLVSYIVLWILFIVLAIVLISVLHLVGNLYKKLEGGAPRPTGLAVGESLPEIRLHSLDGGEVPISKFLGVESAFLIVSPACSGCLQILKRMVMGKLEPSTYRTIVLIKSDFAATHEMLQHIGLPHNYPILVDAANLLERFWGVRSTPVIIEVDAELKISRQGVVVV